MFLPVSDLQFSRKDNFFCTFFIVALAESVNALALGRLRRCRELKGIYEGKRLE